MKTNLDPKDFFKCYSVSKTQQYFFKSNHERLMDYVIPFEACYYEEDAWIIMYEAINENRWFLLRSGHDRPRNEEEVIVWDKFIEHLEPIRFNGKKVDTLEEVYKLFNSDGSNVFVERVLK